MAESQFFCSPAGEQDLLARNIEGPDDHSIVLRHVQGQCAPAAASVHDLLPRLQSQLAAYVVQFRYLRLLQRRCGRRIISAGIDELRVEPELVKSGIKIVVALDITTRAAQGVSLNIFHALRDEFDVPSVMFDLRYRAIKDFEGGDEISLQGDAPLAVRIAKFSFQFD